MLLATCYLLLLLTLLPTRYVCDSYTILIAVIALPTDPDLRRLKFEPTFFFPCWLHLSDSPQHVLVFLSGFIVVQNYTIFPKPPKQYHKNP